MKEKRIFVLILATIIVSLLSLGIASAANDTDVDAVAKGYSCLQNLVKDKTTLSLQEATFAMLALGSSGNKNLEDVLDAQKDSKGCWPKAACKLKETAQAALAYNRIGKSTSDVEKWIYLKNITSTDLKWYLEIDIPDVVTSNCTIKYGSETKSFKVLNTMEVRGTFGSCFSTENQYMLRINSNCLDSEFEISCDQNFVTTILYQKTTGGTTFIPAEIHSATSLGTTSEKVNAKCFKLDKGCDYEGTLWAALFLLKAGKSVLEYVPYLAALSEDNTKYFPSAFIYLLTGGDYSGITQAQKQAKYWEASGSTSLRYYDTSLGMLALSGTSAQELDNAKTYLLSVQSKEGCWNSNNIRDTAFVLYSGWPKAVAGGGGTSPITCDSPHACEKATDCTSASGEILYDFECPNAGQMCCSVSVAKQSCTAKGGILCAELGKVCDGPTELASDGTCCKTSCKTPEVIAETCTAADGICKETCADNEDQSAESCGATGNVCCIAKPSSSLWIWIILLVILVVLVALGIIFREKVKLWWLKIKDKFSKKPTTPARPSAPIGTVQRPTAPPRAMPPAMYRPGQMQRVAVKPAPAGRKDKEMEETLKRLREMGK